MNNKKKSVLVISIALIVFLNVSISFLIVNSMSKSTEVYVAKVKLIPRIPIKEDDIEIIKMPKHLIPSNIVSSKEEIVGKVVSYDSSIYQGMFFFEEALDHPNDSQDAPLLRLKDNQVAVSLGIDVIQSLGNTLLPGQYVDIVYTYPIRNQNPIVETIYKNVRVLSLKDRYGFEMDHPKSQKTPHVILLALNHKDANSFYLALNKGKMDLVPVFHNKAIQQESVLNTMSSVWSYLYE